MRQLWHYVGFWAVLIAYGVTVFVLGAWAEHTTGLVFLRP